MSGIMTVIGNQDLSYGTCVLGSTFGKINDADLQRLADQEVIPDCCGGVLAVLLRNPRYEFKFTAKFPASGTLPTLAQTISFPVAGVAGQIIKFGRKWTENGVHMIDIEATSWDSLGSEPSTASQYCGDD
jgi:hypothetical protein